MTAMLPSLATIPARPPRQVDFGIQSTHPAYSLSTLQTPRCRDACKTRYWPACLALARLDFHQQVDTSFTQRNRRTTLAFAPPRRLTRRYLLPAATPRVRAVRTRNAHNADAASPKRLDSLRRPLNRNLARTHRAKPHHAGGRRGKER